MSVMSRIPNYHDIRLHVVTRGDYRRLRISYTTREIQEGKGVSSISFCYSDAFPLGSNGKRRAMNPETINIAPEI